MGDHQSKWKTYIDLTTKNQFVVCWIGVLCIKFLKLKIVVKLISETPIKFQAMIKRWSKSQNKVLLEGTCTL